MNVNEQQGISPKLHMMALIVAPTAATFANAMKELLTDTLRDYILEKPGDKNLIKYMLSGADTGAGVTRVPTEKLTTFNFRVFFFFNFPTFLWFGRTAKHSDDETKTNTKKKEKHAHRSQRQLMLQAHEVDNTELNDGMDEKLDEGK